ncbi:MAG: recombinase RmuC [Francisellaceae bacterium]|nr:recombinase RmuC [Francisellaceae bacterium]
MPTLPFIEEYLYWAIGCLGFWILSLLLVYTFIHSKTKAIHKHLELTYPTLEQNIQQSIIKELSSIECNNIERLGNISHSLERRISEQTEALFTRLSNNNQIVHETLRQGMIEITQHLKITLSNQAEELAKSVTQLNHSTDARLKEISNVVEKRLNEGFDKTTETFTDIVKRLALIDDAQKRLTELSGSVISLQAVLADKRSRGAFGEIQLKNLIHNMVPAENYSFQHTLSNGLRADCLLFLPPPTGNIVIDSKFPLENFHRLTDFESNDSDRKKAQQAFKQDIKKHIQDIAIKYVIKGETADGALMFIPAEAVFAEIHAHFPDLVEFAQRSNIWLASPTTMMAILTTASAVLKDSATRKHIHIIQEHLRFLADDFSRFEVRMNKLAKHIDQAQLDVQQVNTSAKKIAQRFNQIEKVEHTELLPDGIL